MCTRVPARASSQLRYMLMRLPPKIDTSFTRCRLRPMCLSILCSSALLPTIYSRSSACGTKAPLGMRNSSPRCAAQISTSATRSR